MTQWRYSTALGAWQTPDAIGNRNLLGILNRITNALIFDPVYGRLSGQQQALDY
jgi:hypothetical protein